MPTRSEKKRRRGKNFIIALAALIFAEAGYILWVTGLGHIILGNRGAASVDFSAVLSASEMYVLSNGTMPSGRPEYYRNAYVYVVAYAPGIPLPRAVVNRMVLDAAERPVYVLPRLLTGDFIDRRDFVNVLPNNTKNPVVVLIYPKDKKDLVEGWLRSLNDLTQSNYIKIELRDGRPVSVVAVP